MTKTDLIANVSKRTGVNTPMIKIVLDGLLEEIQTSVENGEEVYIVGFGTWSRRFRNSRVSFNPITGERTKVAARNVPAFTFSKKFKDRVKRQK